MPNEFRVKRGLIVEGSGSNLVTVDGISGRLFTVNDSFSGSLFSVNTVAGLPVIEAFSDNTVRIGQFGQRALFVSQSRVGIGKESALGALLDVSGSVFVTGSFSVSGSVTTYVTFTNTGSSNYTIVLSDTSRMIEMTSSAACTVTVPSSSVTNFPIGSQITVIGNGTGQVTINSGSVNVILRSAGARYKLTQQYSAATLTKRGTDEWYLFGDLTL